MFSTFLYKTKKAASAAPTTTAAAPVAYHFGSIISSGNRLLTVNTAAENSSRPKTGFLQKKVLLVYFSIPVLRMSA